MASSSVNDDPFRFDFKAEIERLLDSNITVNRDSGIAIWGGEFDINKLAVFIRAWDQSGIPNCIWEYAHRIEFRKQLPSDNELGLLDRGHIFGQRGDLSLRRDGTQFIWRFIGEKSVVVPEGYANRDFWDENKKTQLRCYDEAALLWGQRKTFGEGGADIWQEDRVAWAALDYPGLAAERVQLAYTIFTEDGQPMFVWWKELQPYV